MIPFVSTVTGTWITPEQAQDPSYWTRAPSEDRAVRPGRSHPPPGPRSPSPRSGTPRHPRHPRPPAGGRKRQAARRDLAHRLRAKPSVTSWLEAVGQAWTAGVSVDWRALSPGRRRVLLPTYPFERQRYWVDPRPLVAPAPTVPEPAPVSRDRVNRSPFPRCQTMHRPRCPCCRRPERTASSTSSGPCSRTFPESTWTVRSPTRLSSSSVSTRSRSPRWHSSSRGPSPSRSPFANSWRPIRASKDWLISWTRTSLPKLSAPPAPAPRRPRPSRPRPCRRSCRHRPRWPRRPSCPATCSRSSTPSFSSWPSSWPSSALRPRQLHLRRRSR